MPVLGAVIQSDFASNLDGWTLDPGPGTTASISWASTGGNPGGYLFRGQGDTGGVSVLVAPPKFIGNLTAYNGGTFAWDGRILSSGGPVYNANGSLTQPDYGTVRIDGGGDFAVVDVVNGIPPSAWTTFSTPLTASNFGVSAARWNNILGNVTSVRLSVEAIFGPETEAIDNVAIASTPEPSAGLLLVSMVIVGMGRRRKT